MLNNRMVLILRIYAFDREIHRMTPTYFPTAGLSYE